MILLLYPLTRDSGRESINGDDYFHEKISPQSSPNRRLALSSSLSVKEGRLAITMTVKLREVVFPLFPKDAFPEIVHFITKVV
jgi:hypothetical protein